MKKQDEITTNKATAGLELIDYFVRTYTRTELAIEYMPNVQPATARRNFNKWLRKAPELEQKLLELGADSDTHIYTPRQVRCILEQFGIPGVTSLRSK